jgi:protein tyrosine phosphatase
MKVGRIQTLFQDPSLQKALIGAQKDGEKVKEVRERDFAPNLFKSKDREKLIPIYLKVIDLQIKTAKNPKNFVRLLQKFEAEFSKGKELSKDVAKIAQECLKTHADKIDAKKKKKSLADSSFERKKQKIEKKELGLDGSKQIDCGKFPDATCKLSALGSIKEKEIKKFLEEIKKRRKEKDLSLVSKSKNDAKKAENKKRVKGTFPWDENRSGKEIPGLFVNASDVILPGFQNFIFAGCPTDKAHMGDYYDVLLRKGVQIIVTVNKEGERGDTPAFWTQKELNKVKLREGGKIALVSQKEIARSDKPVFTKYVDPSEMSPEELAAWVPRVQESVIGVAKDEKSHLFTHLYYDNWHDHQAPPCLKTLYVLVDRIDELTKSRETPIAINCHGGVGRTGVVGAILYGRRKIDAELAKGKKLDDIEINIPELVYDLCKQRQGMVSHGSQLIAVYASLASYYESLKAKEEVPSELDAALAL